MDVVDTLRAAARALRARPSYTVAASLTLALGIGSVTAVFSVVDALMLRSLPYRDADRVVNFGARQKGFPANASYSMQAWREFQQRADVFDAVEAYQLRNVVMTGGTEPLNVTLLQTSPGAFAMLGVSPQLGRWLRHDDLQGATGPVVVISHRLWREQLGSDPDVINRTVSFDDVLHTVVGVMPPEFVFPRVGIRAWVPLPPPAAATAARPQYQLVGRLRPDVSFERADEIVRATTPRLLEIAGLPTGRDAALDRQQNLNQRDRQPIWIMFGAVVLVLAIACANVANLALAVGARRQREFAVCLALGASRARLAAQLVSESLMVGAAGGLVGAWLAYVAVRTVAPLMPPEIAFFNANMIHIDARVLTFAIAITTLTAVLAGLLPAARNSGGQATDALRSGGRTMSASRLERRTLSTIAIAQCALAVLLLVGASVLMRSFLRLQAVHPGVDVENLAVLKFSPPRMRYGDAAAQQALRDRLVAELQSVPGVLGVTLAGGNPPSGGAFWFDVDLEINTAPAPVARGLYVAYMPVSPDYFSVMRIPMRAGRGLTTSDSPQTVVIDETFATRYWGNPAAAVGARFRVDTDEPWLDVVGVVGDVKQMGLDDRLGELEYYYSWNRSGAGWGSHAIAIRTASNPATMMSMLKERVWRIDPRLALTEADDMQALFRASIARPRFFLGLMIAFALVAATLAGIGIYSLFSYSVSQRTAEIGIRLAVGATPARVGWLVLGRGLFLAGSGAVVGLAGVWASSRVLRGMLFQTTPTDPVAVTLGTVMLVVLALAASYVPAKRAERVDPLVMLRTE